MAIFTWRQYSSFVSRRAPGESGQNMVAGADVGALAGSLKLGPGASGADRAQPVVLHDLQRKGLVRQRSLSADLNLVTFFKKSN